MLSLHIEPNSGAEDLLPEHLPFKEPSGELTFLEYASVLVDNWLDLLMQAFDVGSSRTWRPLLSGFGWRHEGQVTRIQTRRHIRWRKRCVN